MGDHTVHSKNINSQKIPLTVVILTNRHDKRFQAARRSAQRASEVLIKDTQGKPPITNFSAVRNAMLTKAKHEWVLFLDSDEVIDEKSWPHIELCVRNNALSGMWVRRKDVFYGKTLHFGEAGNTWILRLVRKSTTKFIRPVHERARVEGETQRSRITLFHFSHPTLSDFLSDIARYAQLEARYQADTRLPVFLLGLKTFLFPVGKFFMNYIVRFGFLDGWRGLAYALMMSLHSLWVRVFSYENR